jgi:D-aminopeptidase
MDSDSNLESGSLILILAVDIPLLPFQIKQITSSIVVSLPPVNILNNFSDSVTCLLFSTANTMSMERGGPSVFEYSLVNDSILGDIVRAGAEAVKEAICRSLLLSSPVQGRLGRRIETIPDKEAEKLMREFE